MTADEILRRGMAAGRLLGDETFILALTEIENECRESWANSPPADVSRREDAYQLNRAVSQLRFRLETWRDSASVERKNAEWRSSQTRAAG